jgi:hypothetical protein
MKLDDWKARLRASKSTVLACDPPARPEVVFGDGPPVMILVKPESLLVEPGRLDPFRSALELDERDYKLLAAIGHDAPTVNIQADRDILSSNIAFCFRLTNEGHYPMIVPAKYRRRNDGRGEFPTIELVLRPTPALLGLARRCHRYHQARHLGGLGQGRRHPIRRLAREHHAGA